MHFMLRRRPPGLRRAASPFDRKHIPSLRQRLPSSALCSMRRSPNVVAAANLATTQATSLDESLSGGLDAKACPPTGSDAHARLAQLVSLLRNPVTPVASVFVQAKAMQTQELVSAMLAAMQQADPPRPRYVYAVLRLIDRRADLAQAATSDALGCLLRILSDLQGQGLSPWCKQLIDLSYLQVCNPAASISRRQRADMMATLASLLGGANGDGVMSAESLLDLTCTLAREIDPAAVTPASSSQRARETAAPPAASAPPASPSLPANHATAIRSLLKLLLRYRQGQALGRGDDEAGGSAGAPGTVTAQAPLDSALSASLGDLAQACGPYVTQLGPEGAADLVGACSEFNVDLPWGVMKGLLTAATSSADGPELWAPVLGHGLATLQSAAPDSSQHDLQHAEAALMKLFEAPGSAHSFLDHAVVQLINARLAGQGGRGASLSLLAAAARMATAAAARGTCSADTLACAARCLAEAGQMEAGLTDVLAALTSKTGSLTLNGCCHASIAFSLAAASGSDADWKALESLAAHVNGRLAAQPMTQLPASLVMGLLASSAASERQRDCLICLASSVSAGGSSTALSPLSDASRVQLLLLLTRVGRGTSRPAGHQARDPALKQQLSPESQDNEPQDYADGDSSRASSKGRRLTPSSPASPSQAVTIVGSPAHVLELTPGEASRVRRLEVHLALGVAHLLRPGEAVKLLLHLASSGKSPQWNPSRGGGSREAAAAMEDEPDDDPEGGRGVSAEGGSLSPPPTEALPLLLSRLGTRMTSRLAAFDERQLVAVCTAMSRLHWRPGLLLQAICQRLVGRLHRVPPEEALSLLRSLAKLRYNKRITASIAASCLARARPQLQQQQRGGEGGLSPSQLATMVWACGRLRFRDDALLKPVLQTLIQYKEQLPVPTVSNVVWSCGRLGYATERLSAWAVAQVAEGRGLAKASPQALSNLAWGLSRLGHKPQPALLAGIVEASLRFMGPRGSPAGGGRMGSSSPPAEGRRRMGFKPEELSALLSALATWNARPDVQLLLMTEAQLMAGGKGPAASGFDAAAAVGCVWALVRMGHAPSLGLLQLVASQVVALISGNAVIHPEDGSQDGGIPSSATDQLHALRPADDALVCNFLIACYRARFTPRDLLRTYSDCLHHRLSMADEAVASGGLTEGGSEDELSRRSLDELGGGAGSSSTAAPPSSDDGEEEGGPARAIPGRPGRLSPDASGAAAAALALGLHRWRDHALFKLLERAAIQRRSSGEAAMTPAQISRLLHAFSLVEYCPRAWFSRGLPRLLTESLPAMDLQQLARAASALGSWPQERTRLTLPKWRQLLRRRLLPCIIAAVKAAPAPPSPTVLSFLLTSLASLGLYEPRMVETLVGWVMQQAPPALPQQPARDYSVLEDPIRGWEDGPAGAGSIGEAAAAAPPLNAPPADSGLEAVSGNGQQPASGSMELLERGLSDSALCDLVWSLGRLRHDHLPTMQAASAVLVERASSSSSSRGRGGGGSSSGSSGRAVAVSSSPSAPLRAQTGLLEDVASAADAASTSRGPLVLQVADVVRLVWGWAKMNRHPGPQLLEEALRQWEAATASILDPQQQQQQQQLLSPVSSDTTDPGLSPELVYSNLCTLLYSLAMLAEHEHPLTRLVAQQLQALLTTHRRQRAAWVTERMREEEEDTGGDALAASATTNVTDSAQLPASFRQQLPQVAAVLLAAQADRCKASPLNAVLSPAVKAAAMGVWRARVAKKAAARPNRYQYEVASACTRLGLQAIHGAVSPDGSVCPDVLVTLPSLPAARFAMELVGRHNTAANSMRVLGDAAIKYRLLQARGFVVVPISCVEWDELNGDTKALYIQQKLDMRVAAAAAAREAPRMIEAVPAS